MSIVFEISRDPGLLQQYYALREQCFREELGIPDFDGSEEKRDRISQILIAHRDGRCVGGVRISSELQLQAPLGELDLVENACCMWERFVVDPSIRTIKLTREFIAHLIDISDLLGYRHALVLSSMRNARFYRACHTALGVAFEIHRPVPECAQGPFAGLEHYFSVSYLQEARQLQLVA
jgi:hypothetical protein